MKRVFPLVLTLALAFTAVADEASDDLVAALRRALDSRATWTMERTFPRTSRTLASRGTVTCVPETGIVWSVASPFPSRIEMSPRGMAIRDEFSDVEKAARDMPRYDDVFKAVDSFASGDDGGLFALFEIAATRSGSNGWHAVVTPKARELRRLIPEITLDGGATITNAVLRTHDGGISSIRFAEEAHGR